jgi:hypothetical protein
MIGEIADIKPKNNNYRLSIITEYGPVYLYSFDDHYDKLNKIYDFKYKIIQKETFSYNVLESFESVSASRNTRRKIKLNKQDYFSDSKVYLDHDYNEWNMDFEEDIQKFCKQGTKPHKTFKDYYQEEQNIKDVWDDYHYGTKLKHLTMGRFRNSSVSNLCHGTKNKTIYDLPKTRSIAYIDSIFAMVTLRNRHIAEFYLYFAIMTYMKKSRRFPIAKASHVCEFLKAYLRGRAKKKVKSILLKLQKIGMIDIEGNPKYPQDIKDNIIKLRSQQTYVSKAEAAWNARAKKGNQPKYIRKVCTKKYISTKITFDTKNIDPEEAIKMHGTWRPFFDIHFPRTAKVDTGFISLLNSSGFNQRAFLYETFISSINYPICRTRIAQNVLVAPKTQISYEQRSTTLYKRFNFTRLTPDMLGHFSSTTLNKIEKLKKFKITNKAVYRQEGNAFSSERFQWKKSKRCSVLRLSPKFIKRWRAVSPVFNEKLENPRFVPIKGQLKTYTSKKSDIGKAFAIWKNGVCNPSSNPKAWVDFDPLIKYSKNGDRIIQDNPSKKDSLLNSRVCRYSNPLDLFSAGGSEISLF